MLQRGHAIRLSRYGMPHHAPEVALRSRTPCDTQARVVRLPP
jgi:hypothetical protein